MSNTDSMYTWAENNDVVRHLDIPDSLIQLGIDRTTGPGNRMPNPYQVCSYLLNFDYIQHLMWHSAMQPIRDYVSIYYGRPPERERNYANSEIPSTQPTARRGRHLR